MPVSPLVRYDRILDRRFPKEIMSSNVSVMEVKSHEELKFKEGNGVLGHFNAWKSRYQNILSFYIVHTYF
jgi:hypothetical protein